MVSLVPVDVGKPSLRTEKTAIVDGDCHWLNPVYETVKLTQDQKTGKISDKVYQFIVSATVCMMDHSLDFQLDFCIFAFPDREYFLNFLQGSAKSGVLGEININLADYAEVFKPTSVSLPVRDSNNGAILHVRILPF